MDLSCSPEPFPWEPSSNPTNLGGMDVQGSPVALGQELQGLVPVVGRRGRGSLAPELVISVSKQNK